MSTKLQEIKNEIIHFIAQHGITIYKNAVQIALNDEKDSDEFAELINAFNYVSKHDDEGQRRSLPVIVQNEEHLGRFFIQYTNHNYICGYKSLETNEIFPTKDRHLVTNGNTVKEAVSSLWDMVSPNLGKFTSVTYSENSEDILNNIDF